MIHGYPDEASTFPGGRVVLRVSTDAPAFRLLVHRFGARPDLVLASGWQEGRWALHGLPHEDWSERWPAYPLDVPAEWGSGVYVVTLVEGDGDRLPGPVAPGLDGRSARALFVVRAPRPTARLLYKLPLLTYHAYNLVDPHPDRSWSLYSLPDPLPAGTPRTVSVRRPGGGTGGTPWDVFNHDPFDPTPRQTFVHWDARFLAWLDRAGTAVDLCTDLDLDRDPTLLDDRRLLVSAGHDEYWTDAMRDRVEGFVARGGNVAFFGGNTCWWRVVFDSGHAFARVANWSDPEPGRPENTLTGVSYRNGGERDRDDHPDPVGYRVQHADHWVFAGTGLRDGDVLGGARHEYLVGYEADGAHFDRSRVRNGHPAVPTGDDGTPPDFTILGVGECGAWGLGNRAATMGLHGGGGGRGTVFTAATTDWPRVLGAGHPAVGRITRNVLERLGQTPSELGSSRGTGSAPALRTR